MPASGFAPRRAREQRACSPRRGRSSDVESRGSWPAIAFSSSAQSSAVRANGPGLVEARRERDEAVARAHAVGRLQAADAGQRRRLADRAAGVGAGAARHEPRGDRRRRCRRSCRRARSRCSTGFLTGPKYEVSFDEPIANSSMLVLPTSTVPARARPLDDVRVVRRDEVREHPRAAGRAQPGGHQHVLVRDRDAGERAARRRAAMRRVGRLRVGERAARRRR